ncbi:Hypp3119 [Branchiostoma lanceolatum]|uniref:Hypp3119 protein n=1 Tax=Branchiostoma lanceolatum TaxID=7740 RepID=A0A8J9ZX31_BRALA|nr:Hypp3119 [Branchiostoma lanceolatum]
MDSGTVALDRNAVPRSENGVVETKIGMSSSFESKRPSVSFSQEDCHQGKPKSKLPKDAADVREISAQIVADVLARSVLEHLVVNQKRLGLNAEALAAARAAAHWAASRPAAPCLHNPEAAAWEVIQATDKALKASQVAREPKLAKKDDVKNTTVGRVNGKNGHSVANGTNGDDLAPFLEPLELSSKKLVFLAVNDNSNLESTGGSHCLDVLYKGLLLREAKPAVVTFIDYAAAFDTESQLFLDEALSSAGASLKVRRIIQAIFGVATGCVRVTSPSGNQELSEPFEISRGVLQGDIFSPVAFIIGLMRIFELHDSPTSGVTVGSPPYQVTISRLEYADDAGLMDESVQEASERISAIASGSRDDAAMEISVPKTKAMHIHRKDRVSTTTEAEVAALNLKHKCPDCTRDFPTKRGLAIHRSRWCLHHPSTANTRSRAGSLADKEVQRQKRVAKEKERGHVTLQGQQLENVHTFDYLGSRMQCDGDQKADVKYRMDIAQSRFSSLQHIWRDHRLPHAMKIRLYKSSVCSTLTHSCEAWDMTQDVTRMVNGFNSRCLHVITKKHFRDTATNPDYNLMSAIRRRRLRYLGHILRMDPSRLEFTAVQTRCRRIPTLRLLSGKWQLSSSKTPG